MIVTIVRKPLIGSVCTTVSAHNTGGINIDDCRIGTGTGEIRVDKRPNMKSGNYGQDKRSYKDREFITYYTIDNGMHPKNVFISEEHNKGEDMKDKFIVVKEK